MYSAEGKRLVNQVLAGREPVVGNTITMGLNVVYDASIAGTAAPYTHNRYHTPYIVDEITVANSSVVTELNQRDRIVFSGQSESSNRYMANNMGLVLKRNAASRTHRTVANVANGINWTGYTPVSSPTCVFTNDGVLSIPSGSTALYTNSVSLNGYGADDIIAFPLSFHGSSPVGGNINVTIFYLKDGVEQNAQKSATVMNVGGNYYFNFETTAHNYVTSLGTDTAPVPFVYQQRLSQFVNAGNQTAPYSLVNNLRNIKGISIAFSNAAGSTMRFGSIKITPDFAADTSRVTTSFRKLTDVVRKTDLEAYVNPEYTLLGVVV